MTQTEFDKLPGLLTLKVFRSITGLSKEKLRAMRIGNMVASVRAPEGRNYMYRKCDAARLTGFKLL